MYNIQCGICIVCLIELGITQEIDFYMVFVNANYMYMYMYFIGRVNMCFKLFKQTYM